MDLGARVEQLQRRMLVAMFEIRELAEVASGRADGLDLIAVRLRESVDQYASLSLLSNGSKASDEPVASEYELLRVAGRSSADLDLAARCLHRRNAIRLQRHRIQARDDLLQDLAAMQNWLADRALLGAGSPFLRCRKNMFVAARELFLIFGDRTAATEIMDLQRGNILIPWNTEEIQCNTPTPQTRLSIQR